jgi:predicted nucleic acid-binding protein
VAVYLDSSAAVKLVIDEAESDALKEYLRGRVRRFSCSLIRTEIVRAVRRQEVEAVRRARAVLRQFVILELPDALLDRAALIDPPETRSLDAIHVAAALTLGDELEAIVTYDDRMTAAAVAAGLRVDAPGAAPA